MTAIDTVKTTHRPSPRFWDRIADRYARKPVAEEATYQTKLRVTREYLRPETQLLEFGCGTGSTALAHAPFVRQVTATDLSPRMIEIARGKAAAAGCGNVTFQSTSVEDFSAPDGSFDVVLGLSILHLLQDWEGAIARVHRWLRPGGVFVSSTACLGDDMKWFRFVAPVGAGLGLIPLVQVFTEDELVDRLTGSGFEIDHRWKPGKRKGVFIVARKPG